jgi:hypothetical protein
LYGPAPVPSPIPTPQSCVTNPKTYYGPMPCQTDQECVDKFGATWYCNKDYIIDKECNVKWPSCVKR